MPQDYMKIKILMIRAIKNFIIDKYSFSIYHINYKRIDCIHTPSPPPPFPMVVVRRRGDWWEKLVIKETTSAIFDQLISFKICIYRSSFINNPSLEKGLQTPKNWNLDWIFSSPYKSLKFDFGISRTEEIHLEIHK